MKIFDVPDVELQPFDEVRKARTTNHDHEWTSYREGRVVKRPGTALERFSTGSYFRVRSSPSFALESGQSVYTIGSCFARNIERALVLRGMRVPTTDIPIDPDIYLRPTRYKNTVLNKYNPFSMATEILRGLGEVQFQDRGLIEVGRDRFVDPQTSHVPAMSRKQAEALRDILDAMSIEIRSCSVVLLTLGLTETWVDTTTGCALNGLSGVMASIKERLRFFNGTPEQCYSALAQAITAFHDHNPNARAIITVSPVPMAATFTDLDVVSANELSKATLVVTAQRLAATFDFVDYFPSFEMVRHSPRHLAWSKDQVHVNDDMVDFVIGEFMTRYGASIHQDTAK
jgi:hypothetical protein